MTNSQYKNKLKTYSRELRGNSTDGEIILWTEALRAKKMYGYQFNRQFPIENYVVDFIARKLKLIIEVDGYSHQFKQEEDRIRDENLKKLGYTVLRIDEYDIKRDLDNVIRVIEATVAEQEEKIGKVNPPNP